MLITWAKVAQRWGLVLTCYGLMPILSFIYKSSVSDLELDCGLRFELFLKLCLRANPVFSVLFRLVHELVNTMNEGFHVFLWLVLSKADAYRQAGFLT